MRAWCPSASRLMSITAAAAVIACAAGLSHAHANGWQVAITTVDVRDYPTVRAAVRVTDEHRLSVLGLSSAHFRATEDGMPVAFSVASHLRRGDPIHVALIVDRSESMRGAPLRAATMAVREFCRSLTDDDTMSLVSFASTVREDCEPTRDKRAVAAAAERLRAAGKTALWDALAYALRRPWGDDLERRAVIVLTDGYDNRSTAGPDQCIAVAHGKANVFTIALGGASDAERLRAVASACDGEYLPSPTADDLIGIYRQIAGQLESDYEIAFTTFNTHAPSAHRLDVKVMQGDHSGAASFCYFPGSPTKPSDTGALERDLAITTIALGGVCLFLLVILVPVSLKRRRR